MLIMTFLIAQGQSHVLKFNLVFQINITEAKLFSDLTGFEPRTSGSADQQWLSTYHYYNILYADYDLSNGSRSKVTM